MDRHALTIHLFNHNCKDISVEDVESALRDSVPRVVLFDGWPRYHELPSTQEYEKISDRGYVQFAKTYPPAHQIDPRHEIECWPRFIRDYPWHPGADDAAARLAFAFVKVGDTMSALLAGAQTCSYPDGDAHVLAKALVADLILCGRPQAPPTVSRWIAEAAEDPAGCLTRFSSDLPYHPEVMIKVNVAYLQLPRLLLSGSFEEAERVKEVILSLNHSSGGWCFSPLIWQESGRSEDDGWLGSYKCLREACQKADPMEDVFLLTQDDSSTYTRGTTFEAVLSIPPGLDSISYDDPNALCRIKIAFIRASFVGHMLADLGTTHVGNASRAAWLLSIYTAVFERIYDSRTTVNFFTDDPNVAAWVRSARLLAKELGSNVPPKCAEVLAMVASFTPANAETRDQSETINRPGASKP
jgi:hypothetical protein